MSIVLWIIVLKNQVAFTKHPLQMAPTLSCNWSAPSTWWHHTHTFSFVTEQMWQLFLASTPQPQQHAVTPSTTSCLSCAVFFFLPPASFRLKLVDRLIEQAKLACCALAKSARRITLLTVCANCGGSLLPDAATICSPDLWSSFGLDNKMTPPIWEEVIPQWVLLLQTLIVNWSFLFLLFFVLLLLLFLVLLLRLLCCCCCF